MNNLNQNQQINENSETNNVKMDEGENQKENVFTVLKYTPL